MFTWFFYIYILFLKKTSAHGGGSQRQAPWGISILAKTWQDKAWLRGFKLALHCANLNVGVGEDIFSNTDYSMTLLKLIKLTEYVFYYYTVLFTSILQLISSQLTFMCSHITWSYSELLLEKLQWSTCHLSEVQSLDNWLRWSSEIPSNHNNSVAHLMAELHTSPLIQRATHPLYLHSLSFLKSPSQHSNGVSYPTMSLWSQSGHSPVELCTQTSVIPPACSTTVRIFYRHFREAYKCLIPQIEHEWCHFLLNMPMLAIFLLFWSLLYLF